MDSSSPTHTRDEPAPLLMAAAPIGAILVLVGCLAWSFWAVRESLVSQQARQLEVQELTGRLTHLDEVLTMSARLGAATGDAQWEQRSNDHEPPLDDAIKRLIALSPTIFAEELGGETDEANRKLVDMETRAFALVQEGRASEPQAILFSDEYETQKQRYAGGMDIAEHRLREHIAAESARLQMWLWILMLASVLAMLLLIASGLRIRSLRTTWKAQILQQRLEAMAIATRAKSDFLANMSHEIRTPMTGDREKCIAAGCDDHLTKPITRQQLFQGCAAHLTPTHPAQKPAA